MAQIFPNGISTGEELAAATKIPKPHLVQMENGTRQLSEEQLDAIASALAIGNP